MYDYVEARLVPCRDGSIDVKGRREIGAKALDFRRFSASGGFEQVETVNAPRELIHGGLEKKV